MLLLAPILVLAALAFAGTAAVAPSFASAQTMPAPADATRDSGAGVAQALARARQHATQGRNDDALAIVDQALDTTPRDAQLRFERGVLLAKIGRVDEAIAMFRSLTQEFPELPEPYNNLAALHASRGELDQARDALEDALRALPSYALARENLGDVQLRLAERSYRQAIEADAGNRAAGEKLALTRELIAKIAPMPAAAPAAAPAASSPAATPAASTDPAAR